MRTKTFKFPANERVETPIKFKYAPLKSGKTGRHGAEGFNKQMVLDLACMRGGYKPYYNNSFSHGWLGAAYIPHSLPDILLTYFDSNLRIFDMNRGSFISLTELNDLL